MLPSVGRLKCQTRCKSRCADCTYRAWLTLHHRLSPLYDSDNHLVQRRSKEIDVYSQPVDIFQLHNRQMKYFDIHPAAVRTLDNLKCHMGHTDPEKASRISIYLDPIQKSG